MAGRGTDILLGGNPEIQAWATLKNDYASRLDVPPEVWRDTVNPLEGPMKAEGRVIAAPLPTEELALRTQPRAKDPAKLAKIVDEMTPRERDEEKTDLKAFAEQKGIADEFEAFKDLVRLYHAARPGGLHIVGTERHDSRRIDNQLRGRSGRQGDPGSSRFFLSLEDDLMRIFMGDWVRGLLQKMGLKEDEKIESAMVSRRISGAQKKVEERYFEQRKHLLEMDEIMDTQRKRVYGFRQDILEGAPCREIILQIIDRRIEKEAGDYCDKRYGAKAFGAYAGGRLGVRFEDKEFLRLDFPAAVARAKEEARRQSESTIIGLIDENLPEDADQSEWAWASLASQVNAMWGLRVKEFDLRKVGRDKLGEYLYSEVKRNIEGIKLDGGAECFEPDYGVRNFVGWFDQKFAAKLPYDSIPREVRGDEALLNAFLKQKARELYRQKEINFPVQVGLNQFLPDRNQDPNARYDREGLVAWIKQRFGVDVDVNEYRDLTKPKIREKLAEISEKYYGDGALFASIDRKLDEAFPYAKIPQPTEKLAALSQWSEANLGKPLVFEERTLSRERARWQMLNLAEARLRPEIRIVERQVLLQFIDVGWKDHLYGMDHLKSAIGLRGYAQIDPKVEFKREGRQLFEEMWEGIDAKVGEILFKVEEFDPNFVSSVYHVTSATHEQAQPSAYKSEIQQQQESATESGQSDRKAEPIRKTGPKVGRNDPCPCGSGKKYKNCHMRLDQGGARATG